jgi:hypothetical protein
MGVATTAPECSIGRALRAVLAERLEFVVREEFKSH